MRKLFVILVCLPLLAATQGQKSTSAYPSLLWEITGNGLTQPSYLFGTMHVSNKMVFHLSDSFYHAIASCSAVSLELDPRQWQSEMFRIQKSQAAMMSYSRLPGDYLSERSFRTNNDFAANMRVALSEEPYVINSLLYRTAEGQSNFQENTYLDLYVYQTARRLGKRATGVENYVESEKIQLEAQEDMFRERNKTRFSAALENPFDLQRKIQEAYRKGDLSLMDSLSQLTGSSEAYNEKFLYGRNEIQANSIDSIIQKESLFVAVGAAHLPGKRGVIEMLRRKGYTLRPVNMTDRDAGQRDRIDKIRVPVQMLPVTTEDGFIQVNVPGKLYRRNESFVNESWQYADMENGSYYMLSRIKLHGGQRGETAQEAARKTDSLLYENVPGKILEKKNIIINGYNGLDIINKTRRGDIQRYHIFYTPQEVVVFKMSGNEEYVNGKEAEEFFGSIRLKEAASANWQTFAPASGGFSVRFPQAPAINTGLLGDDMLDTHQYEAIDPETGDGYMVMQKSLNNTGFIEEDTFDISLIEHSLLGSDIIDKQLSRKFGKQDGYNSLDMLFSLKDGGVLKARAFIKGAQYWLLTAKSNNAKNTFGKFFSSFKVTPFAYGPSSLYTDSTLGFTVATPVAPAIDSDLKELLNKRAFGGWTLMMDEMYLPQLGNRNASFKSPQTGEAVAVTMTAFPKYYYQEDSIRWLDKEINWNLLEKTFIVEQKRFEKRPDTSFGYSYILSDTNTDRHIRNLVLVKNNALYRVAAVIEEPGKESNFIKDFFNSFRVVKRKGQPETSLFVPKGKQVLKDMETGDSTTQKIARSAIPQVAWQGNDLAELQRAFQQLKPASKDYLATKAALIKAAGSKDTTHAIARVEWLRDVYKSYADTGMFQNAALAAMANIKTKYAYVVIREILVRDPAIFENNVGYASLFNMLGDSLQLSATLFPDLLQLTAFDDYKQPVLNLLAKLVDSNYIKPETYTSQLTKLLFDAQVQMRKMQAMGEREQVRLQADENASSIFGSSNTGNQMANLVLGNYISLLAPLYDDQPQVQKFFNRLFNANDALAKLNATVKLAENHKPIPDTMLNWLAANDQLRATLYERLEKIKRPDLFPAKYNTQEDMSRSMIAAMRAYSQVTDIEPMGRRFVQAKKGTGYVYFYKYRRQKNGDWMIGMAGIQPADTSKTSLDKSVFVAMNKKLVTNGTEQEQFEKTLKQTLMLQHRSAAAFYRSQAGMFGDSMF